MSKDRYKELQENIERYSDGVDISIINHFATKDMEAPVMDDLFDQVHILRSRIDKIIKLIDDVEHLQDVMLASQTIDGIKEKLEEKINEIKTLGHNIRMGLKQMKENHELQNSIPGKHVRQRISELQIDGITKHFCTIMDKYYQSVIIHRKKYTEQIRRQYQSANIVKNDEEIEEILQNGDLNMYPEIIIGTEQTKEKLDIMELRLKELIKLENGIRELHDMFFDVARLTESHDEQIRYIEEKVSEAVISLEITVPTIPAKKVSHCFPLKKKTYLIVGFIIISIIFIVYLITKIIIFLIPI